MMFTPTFWMILGCFAVLGAAAAAAVFIFRYQQRQVALDIVARLSEQRNLTEDQVTALLKEVRERGTFLGMTRGQAMAEILRRRNVP